MLAVQLLYQRKVSHRQHFLIGLFKTHPWIHEELKVFMQERLVLWVSFAEHLKKIVSQLHDRLHANICGTLERDLNRNLLNCSIAVAFDHSVATPIN